MKKKEWDKAIADYSAILAKDLAHQLATANRGASYGLAEIQRDGTS